MSVSQETKPFSPQPVADYSCHCGENPLWNPVDQLLYWCDIPQGRIFTYDPETGSHRICYEGDVVGGFTFQEDGSLILFMERGAIKHWHEGKLSTIVEEIPAERESRFNDVIADPAGRVFCGTMASPSAPGRLYRLDRNGKVTLLLEGILCSNGMGFTPGRQQMYYTDSFAGKIYLFDYDASGGSLTNQRVFATVAKTDGFPDGMTVDREGRVWSARWDGGCLVRYALDGREELRIPFPAKKVSSVIFGGRGYSDLYITTAGGENKPDEGSGAGALFRLQTGVTGVPEFFSRIGK